MSLTKEQLEILEIQLIKNEIENVLEIWIHKNIDVIIFDFDLSYAEYMKTLLKQTPTNFREHIENDYLNKLILRIVKNRQDEEERAKIIRAKNDPKYYYKPNKNYISKKPKA